MGSDVAIARASSVLSVDVHVVGHPSVSSSLAAEGSPPAELGVRKLEGLLRPVGGSLGGSLAVLQRPLRPSGLRARVRLEEGLRRGPRARREPRLLRAEARYGHCRVSK